MQIFHMRFDIGLVRIFFAKSNKSGGEFNIEFKESCLWSCWYCNIGQRNKIWLMVSFAPQVHAICLVYLVLREFNLILLITEFKIKDLWSVFVFHNGEGFIEFISDAHNLEYVLLEFWCNLLILFLLVLLIRKTISWMSSFKGIEIALFRFCAPFWLTCVNKVSLCNDPPASVRPSVCPSVRPSVRPSVCDKL